MSDRDEEAGRAEGTQSGQPVRPGPEEAERPQAVNPDAADEPTDEDSDADLGPRNPIFNIYFNDRVDAREATFGVVDGQAARRSTGRVDPHQIDHALRYYLPPKPYSYALAVLADQHLLVLTGEDGAGRRAGAWSLLREVATGPHLVSLSPAYSLADLARYDFKAGRGYLVVDRLEESTVNAVQEFEAGNLPTKLREAGAYLVVTTAPAAARATPDVVVEWQPPDPEELLEHCLTHAPAPLTEQELTQLRRLVRERPKPRDVVALVDEVGDLGLEAAVQASHGQDRRRISDWFDADPSTRRVVEVASAAFGHGLPQRTFELIERRLLALVNAHARGEREPEPAPIDDSEPLPQSRAGRSAEDGLLTTVREATTEPCRVVFRSPRYREGVLTELVNRCGYELWSPVEQWLRELARGSDWEVRAQASVGLALYSRHEFDEVHRLLRQWSDGGVTERITAAYVLSSMCLDDTLAPSALRTATDWAVNNGPRRAWTAAVALGGELGVRYQSEALRWLWELARRGERIARPARESVAELFRVGERDPASATMVVNFIHRELQRAPQERSLKEERAELAVVVAVLSAGRGEGDQPVAAYLLREQPETTDILGALWSHALRSASHRSDATDALRRTAEGVGQDGVAEAAMRRLGAAVRAGWSDREAAILLDQLESTLRATPDEAEAARHILQVLLQSIRLR